MLMVRSWTKHHQNITKTSTMAKINTVTYEPTITPADFKNENFLTLTS